MSLDTDRLGTTIEIPMDPTAPLPVTPTGGLVLLSGRDALRSDVLRRLVTEPGAMVFRPQFGCGARAKLGTENGPLQRARFAVDARKNLLRDARLKDAVVSAAPNATNPDGVDVSITLTLRDDSKGTVQAAF